MFLERKSHGYARPMRVEPRILSSNDVDRTIHGRFRDRDATEKSRRRKERTEFWMSVKEEVTKIDSRAYLLNRKGCQYRDRAARS